MNVTETKTHYTIDGKPYLRVTSLLETMFKDPEYAQQPRDLAAYRFATRIGTQVDRLITQNLTQQKLKWPKNKTSELLTAWEAYLEYRRVMKPNPEAVQELVYSDECGLAGRLDERDEGVVVEYKATARVLRRHWLQSNTYIRLKWNGSERFSIKRRIVRLDKSTGMADWPERSYSESDWLIVQHLKQAYDLLYPQEVSHV